MIETLNMSINRLKILRNRWVNLWKKGLTPKKCIQKVFQWILVVFGVLNNILKVYQNIPPRKPSFPRWRPKWRRGAWNDYISNWKNVAKEFSTGSGTSGHAYEHTKNLGKYTFRKGFIFKMASKMVAGQA